MGDGRAGDIRGVDGRVGDGRAGDIRGVDGKVGDGRVGYIRGVERVNNNIILFSDDITVVSISKPLPLGY